MRDPPWNLRKKPGAAPPLGQSMPYSDLFSFPACLPGSTPMTQWIFLRRGMYQAPDVVVFVLASPGSAWHVLKKLCRGKWCQLGNILSTLELGQFIQFTLLPLDTLDLWQNHSVVGWCWLAESAPPPPVAVSSPGADGANAAWSRSCHC